jgi:CheY-like chemotaxis protein
MTEECISPVKGAASRAVPPPGPAREKRTAGPASAEPGAKPARPDPPLAGIRVLLVDDDEDDLGMIEIVLGNAGADVTAVVKVEDALRALQRGRPDVVVSDLMIPGHDGFTLIRRIRRMEGDGDGAAAPRPLPALAISSTDTPDQRRYALGEGFTEFLAKPVHEQVVEVVSRLARGASSS